MAKPRVDPGPKLPQGLQALQVVLTLVVWVAQAFVPKIVGASNELSVVGNVCAALGALLTLALCWRRVPDLAATTSEHPMLAKALGALVLVALAIYLVASIWPDVPLPPVLLYSAVAAYAPLSAAFAALVTFFVCVAVQSLRPAQAKQPPELPE